VFSGIIDSSASDSNPSLGGIVVNRKRRLGKAARKDFDIVMRGYNRSQVENMIEEMRIEIEHLGTYNERAASEISTLKAEVLELKIQVKTGGPNGYVALRAQFEQTLGLAEEQAEKMLADAGQYALRIREESKSAADALKRGAKNKADRIIQEAEMKMEEARLEAASRHAEILNAALVSVTEANDRLQKAQTEASAIKSDGEKYAREIRSQVHLETRATRASLL
jgi:cell division septum initiation protein DivIVA